MSEPIIGEAIADFALPATGNQDIRLSDLKGQNVVVYFYPKDNTTGCIKEGLQFRDLHDEFKAANTVVLGVSRDSVKVHENFKAKQDFPFDLLSDKEEVVCTLFDVIKLKKMYGREYMGIVRSTFLIDAEGILREQWRKIKLADHAQLVLDAVKNL